MIVREPIIKGERNGVFGRIGQEVMLLIGKIGRGSMIGIGAFAQMRYMLTKRSRREIVRQLYICAVKSLPVVTVVAFFIGMVLALQLGIELRSFNQEHLIGSVVMATMLREMGPFMAGLVLAASVGASMAAQMGTMTVNDEIAALEIMSINPLRFLVMPRMVAMLIAMPLLSFYTCILALIGGSVVGYTQLAVPLSAYWTNAMDFANLRSLYVGLFKATIFGVIIVTVSCYEGFTTSRGAVGVGSATRASVVINFLLILVIGYFVTRLFY